MRRWLAPASVFGPFQPDLDRGLNRDIRHNSGIQGYCAKQVSLSPCAAKTMLTHRQIWGAIDALAALHRLTPSGLAKLAGLDPTSFNKSKRATAAGKARWPSTESIAKILEATGASLEDFVMLVTSHTSEVKTGLQPVALSGFSETGANGNIDPYRLSIDIDKSLTPFPGIECHDAYALEVSSDSMEPLYRKGDILIVSPNSEIRPDDRVLLKTRSGKILATTFEKRTAGAVELALFDTAHEKLVIDKDEIDWMVRIIWASQ